MGREEIGDGTGEVPAFICCATYFSVCTVYQIIFTFPVSEDPYLNGFAAHMIATLIIFQFSQSYKNSSLIDPSWYLLPLITGTGWLLTSDSMSLRGMCA